MTARADASDVDGDVLGAWQIRSTTPDDQQHPPTLTVIESGGKLYGWYSGKDHELPASSLSLDGDQVTMTISTKTPVAHKSDRS